MSNPDPNDSRYRDSAGNMTHTGCEILGRELASTDTRLPDNNSFSARENEIIENSRRYEQQR